MIPLLFLAAAACLPVGAGSDQIVAGDLVPAYPEMASLDPATAVALAPEPGVVRTFRANDLRLLAVRFGLPAVPGEEFCVNRTVAPLDAKRLLRAMQTTLPEAHIEILEYSRQPAPAGEIEFARPGLHQGTAQNGALWMGSIHYGATRRFSIWARVRVTCPLRRVLAVGDLMPERAIQGGQVIEETREEFPAPGDFASSLEQVQGKWPRLPIHAGAEIRLDQLAVAKEVARGDRVQVDVFEGGAHLEFEGIAESSGAAGEMIAVRNPENNRRFRARVESKGRVTVNSNAARVSS